MDIKKNELLVGTLSILLLVQLGTFGMLQNATAQSEIKVPKWIRDLGEFWADGGISDKEFANAIEYLIQFKIITSERLSILDDIDENAQEDNQKEITIPNWIRTNAKWFAEGVIQESDFVLGLEYMVEERIIKSPRIQIIENESRLVTDSDNDGLLDGVDACPTQAETVNGFEDSDGCPDVIPVQDKSLTISDVDIEWKNSGWGNQKIYISWTYFVNEEDLPDGHFVIELSGIVNDIVKAEYDQENKFAGEVNGIDPGIEGGTITMEVISFIGDEGWDYVGDGNKIDVTIPAFVQ